MSIYGCSDPKEPGERVGPLDMRGFPVTSVADPESAQDAATKRYVDSNSVTRDFVDSRSYEMAGHYVKSNVERPRPLITVWAEESGPLNARRFEWSFGDGATGKLHKESGYPMLASGRILRLGISSTARTGPPTIVAIGIVVNGQEVRGYRVNKPQEVYSAVHIFSSPLEVKEGDRINFRSVFNNAGVTSTVVSLLIELDL